MRTRLQSLMLIVWLVLAASPAHAISWYISLPTNSPAGNDANTCGQAQNIATPKATMNSILACPTLLAGDTVYIRGGPGGTEGDYDQRMDFITAGKSGAAGSYLTISGYPGEKVRWHYTDTFHVTADYGGIKAGASNNYIIFTNFILDGSRYSWAPTDTNPGSGTGWSIRDGMHDIIVDNVEITGQPASGLFIGAGSHHVTVRNSHFHHACGFACYGDVSGWRWYAMYIHDGTDYLIENNEFDNNPGGGMQLYPGTFANVVVRQNKIHHSQFYSTSPVGGILFVHDSTTVGSTTDGVQFINNSIYNNGTPSSGLATGIELTIANATKFITNTKILNNTIFGNKSNGLTIGGGSQPLNVQNTVIQNNIVFGNGLSQIVNLGSGTIQDHNFTGDPLFVNAGAFDFHLQATSQAVNAGTALALVPIDLDGVTRPQGSAYDIGAYELAGAPTFSTYHVSPTGLDANGCAAAKNTLTPLKTIAVGVTCPGPGDTLYLRGGTYNEPIHLTTLGAVGKFITVSGYPGETAIIQLTNSQFYPLGATLKQYHIYQSLVIDGSLRTLEDTNGGVIIGANDKVPDNSHDVILQDSEIKNIYGVGIFTSHANNANIIIRRNKVHDLFAHDAQGFRYYCGYIAHGSGVLIEANELYNCPGGGLQIYPNPSNVTVRKNKIHHNNTLSSIFVGGILVQQDLTLGPAMGGIVIDDNLIYANGTPTSGNAYGVKVNNVDGVQMRNNTIVGNKSYGIGVGDGQLCCATNTNFQNNILFQNLLGPYTVFANATGTTGQAQNFTTDPLFVNGPAFDYHLQAGSGAVDTAVALAAVPDDLDGVTRPQGAFYDFGAYELVNTGKIYFVATNGSDAALGTAAAPFRSIHHCGLVALAGETCLVNDGQYFQTDGNGQPSTGRVVYLNTNSGTQAKPIVFKSVNKWGAVINLPNKVGPNEANTGIHVAKSWITIDGFKIQQFGAISDPAANNVSNNAITSAFSAITGLVAKNNWFYHIGRDWCTNTGSGFAGMFIGINATSNITIDSNVFESIGRLRNGENGCATTLFQNDHGMYIDGLTGGITDIWITRNLILDTNRGWGLQFYGQPGATTTNAHVWNNTFVGHAPPSVQFCGDPTLPCPRGAIITGAILNNADFRNNIFYDIGDGAFQNAVGASGSNLTYDFNLTDDATRPTMWNTGGLGKPAYATDAGNNITNRNPLFTNPALKDYSLGAGSPAIDSGVNVGLTAPACTGTCDRGYLESTNAAPPDTTAPPAPTILRAR